MIKNIILFTMLLMSFATCADVKTKKGVSVGWHNYPNNLTLNLNELFDGGNEAFNFCIVSETYGTSNDYSILFDRTTTTLTNGTNDGFSVDVEIINNNSGITENWLNGTVSMGSGNTISECNNSITPYTLNITVSKIIPNGNYGAGQYCATQSPRMTTRHSSGKVVDRNHPINICLNWTGSVPAPELQVGNLNDITLGIYDGNPILPVIENFCIYSQSIANYYLTMEDLGDIGNFELINGAINKISYNLNVKNQTGGILSISENVPYLLPSSEWSTSDISCSITSELLDLELIVDNLTLETAPAGTYTSTLYITISPE